jgi:hypothetical protein
VLYTALIPVIACDSSGLPLRVGIANLDDVKKFDKPLLQSEPYIVTHTNGAMKSLETLILRMTHRAQNLDGFRKP